MKKPSISKVKEMLENGSVDDELLESLKKDSRKGIQELLQKYYRQKERTLREKERLQELKKHEMELASRGYHKIAGIDEAGRGPLAGPVVAAAVILPPEVELEGLNDSKKIGGSKRKQIFEQIKESAFSIGIGKVEPAYIDEINIHQASLLAMRSAMEELFITPEYILVDGYAIPEISCPQKALKHGDSISFSIAAASIIAKVSRDKIMEELDAQYPQYGFASHKGYGTEAHRRAIEIYGISPVHRKTFTHNLF